MPSIATLAQSFARTQKAEGRSPWTIALYRDCIARLVKYMTETTGSDDLSNLNRRLLRDFYAVRSETVAPATVATDFKVHRVFLGWLVSEEELPSNPIDKLRQPKQAITPVPVFTDDARARLLAACRREGVSGRANRERATRGTAILRLLISTGLRRGELCRLRVEDVNLAESVIRVTGKGKTRWLPLTPKTEVALDRWIRVRRDTPTLFGLTESGLYQVLRDIGDKAGIKGVRPHRFRHDFAHRWLVEKGNEGDLMQIAGWSSRSLLDRYGASAAAARAMAAHRRMNLDDGL